MKLNTALIGRPKDYVMENMEDGWRKIAKKLATNVSNIHNGAKLAVASVARATPLFPPRPEIMYINVLHYSAFIPRLAPLLMIETVL